MRDLFSNIGVRQAIVPAVKTAAADGIVIDTLGFNRLAFAISTGAIVSAGAFGVKIQHSDTTTGGDFVDAPADVVDTNAPATLAASSAYKVGYRGNKRYVRLQLTTAGGTSIALGAVAVLSLLHAIGPERVPYGEATFAAVDRKQAGRAFKEALSILREDKRLVKATRVYDAHNSAKKIVYPTDGVTLEVISGDAGTAHGATPAFVLADEIHIWPNRDLWEALTTGLDKADNPLLVVATTAGRGQDTFAWDVIEDARKVARGEVDDPSILPVLFEAGRDDDWRDEEVWHRCNPGLRHGYPSLDGFRRHARRAERSIGERQSLLQLKLNVWLDQTVDPFVDMVVYDKGKKALDLDVLKDQPCWLAVDLSSTIDLSVIVACWRTADGYAVAAWFFCPEDNLDDREDGSGAAYRKWVEEGLIEATPGSTIDFRRIRDKVIDLHENFAVQEIAFDPFMARQVQPELLDMGLPVVDMRQIPSLMMPAFLELERAILADEFRHGANPVLRHCFSNVVVRRNDQGHVAKFTKSKRWLSIDGAVAAAMAVARCAAGDTNRSSYDGAGDDFESWAYA